MFDVMRRVQAKWSVIRVVQFAAWQATSANERPSQVAGDVLEEQHSGC